METEGTSSAIQAVLEFVEGRIGSEEFESVLYEDPGFENLLTDDPDLPPDTYIGRSIYQYVLEQDYRDPGGVLNAQAALSEFLSRRGIEHSSGDAAEAALNALLDAQPEWLDVETRYLRKHYLDHAEGRTSRELVNWLRAKLLADFRCVGRPPKWFQNPEWPIGDNGPLVFLGQVSVKDYFHDTASVYVFHDPATDEQVTVLQVM